MISLIGGYRIDDAIRSHFLWIIVLNRHPCFEARSYNERLYAEVPVGKILQCIQERRDHTGYDGSRNIPETEAFPLKEVANNHSQFVGSDFFFSPDPPMVKNFVFPDNSQNDICIADIHAEKHWFPL